MISGLVNEASREALIRLFVKGPTGMLHEVEAAIDTGFTEDLTLPADLIAALGLPFERQEDRRLSNGAVVPTNVYRASVLWDGSERRVDVEEGEGTPLVGMGLLLGHLLTVRAEEGGEVRIEPLP